MTREKRWALITGASGEIGRAIGMRLASQGIPLYLHYFRSQDRLDPLLTYCQEREVPAYALQADLRDPEQVSRLFSQMPVKPLLLVNNASIDHVGTIDQVTTDQFDDLVAVNIRSAFFVCQSALPQMIREQYGRIINLSSIWGLTGGACEVLYSLTKGAIVSFSKALAKEVAPSGVTVNAVAPGAIEGGMMARFSREEQLAIAEEIPAGRLGRPEEVASIVAYLLSEEAGYITGQVVSANGGWYT
ncbi:SDR family oxidoreductase [Brevibacillus humidisoli]|uniref:elongation factor P 5-aminopentanone reductase n=1 Tax=Brevibacillus humidisoli TaxID=2895522 RepID=UPI001E5B6DB7|nr:SDR family oxidoreductase [Brevibacillus humidisoli]UFJ42204.1 SDR family oxidoreductase [Brevibacillus humidisoli]